ncbi:MAG: sensor domain-containing diguanylate cyclase, partial [Pseudomonadota bacterium]
MNAPTLAMVALPLPAAQPLPPRRLQRSYQAGIRTWLVLVGGLVLAPMVALAIFLVFQVHSAAQSATERELAQRTEAASHAVRERLESAIGYLNALAVSDAALHGDLPTLYAQARRVADIYPGVSGIGLVGPDLKTQFITVRPFGAPLTNLPDTSTPQRVFATGAPAVSGQFKGPYTGKSVVSVGVPVFRKDEVAYVLFMVLTSESLSDLLLAQSLPTDWTAGIVDRRGNLVARSRAAEKYVGSQASPELLTFLRESKLGFLDAVTKDGIPVLGYVSPVSPYHWHVAIGVPKDMMAAPLRRNLLNLTLAVLVIFALGLAGAALAGKALERWTLRLLVVVRAMKTGQSVELNASGVRELDQMARSLTEVNNSTRIVREDLRNAQTARAQANRALELARMDGLTGLRARGQFRDDASAVQAALAPDAVLALLFIDLDRFKSINDRFGHEIGDQVLMAVATALQTAAGSQGIPARWGGDEFVLAFTASVQDMDARVADLCRTVGRCVGTVGYDLGCSIGVAFWDATCLSLDELVRRADASMYRQKALA